MKNKIGVFDSGLGGITVLKECIKQNPNYEYIKRQALHCKTITFLHPVTHKEITVTTDLPEDMQNIIR